MKEYEGQTIGICFANDYSGIEPYESQPRCDFTTSRSSVNCLSSLVDKRK